MEFAEIIKVDDADAVPPDREIAEKISWLDSTRHYSRVHLTNNGKTTLCGYPFADHFESGRWVSYRVSKGRQGVCQSCSSKLDRKDLNIALKSWSIPENDIRWVHNHHGAKWVE